jgi:hypothetical protein
MTAVNPQGGEKRECDRCRQVLPKSSKLSYYRVPLQEVPEITARLDYPTDGRLAEQAQAILDLCLQCQIWYTHKKRGLV